MPKRGSDADSRIFFDELVSIAASRLRATGAIRLEDRQPISVVRSLARATRPAGSRRARPRRASSPNATDTPRRRAYALANTDAAKALAARTAEIAKQADRQGARARRQ